MIKILATATILVLALTACKHDQGVKKGPFEQECEVLKGTFERVSANEYTCTLPDGTVLKSQEKK